MDCLRNFTNSVSGCLDEEEGKQKEVFSEIAEKLLEFVCYKDGDHIARKNFQETNSEIDLISTPNFSIHRRKRTRMFQSNPSTNYAVSEQNIRWIYPR